jgi:dipeptide transport system substrate-binding protein
MLALRAGEADMVMQPAATDLRSLRTDPQFTVHEVQGLRVVFVGFVTTRPPVDDLRVRQAMNLGFDRRPVLENILEGAAALPTGPIAPGVLGYRDVSRSWAYDPQRAETLLDEAGWKRGPDGTRSRDGKPLLLRHYAPRGRYYKDAQISEAFQDSMRRLGIRVDLQIQEWASIGQKWAQGFDSELFTVGWVTTTADPDATFPPLFTCGSRSPKGSNAFMYCNARVDELAERARHSTDQKQRAELYGQAVEAITRDHVMVPVYTTKEIVVTRAAVKNFAMHPIEYFLWVDSTWLDR